MKEKPNDFSKYFESQANSVPQWQSFTPVNNIIKAQTQSEESASFFDSFLASAKRESVLAAGVGLATDALTNSFISEDTQLRTPGYDVFKEDVIGTKYEPYANSFVGIVNPYDAAKIKQQIDNDVERRDLAWSNWIGGFAGAIVGFGTDTAALAAIQPAAGVMRFVGGLRGVPGTLKAMAIASGYEAVREGIFQLNDESRTKVESAFNIAAAGIFQGAFSSLATISDAYKKQLNSELMRITAKNNAGINKVELKTDGDNVLESATDLITNKQTIIDNNIDFSNPFFKLAWNVTKLFPTIEQRLLTSPLNSVKEFSNKLLEHPYILNKNSKQGLRNDISAETLISLEQHKINPTLVEFDSHMQAWKQELGISNFNFQAEREFNERVGNYLITGVKEGVSENIIKAGQAVRNYFTRRGEQLKSRNLSGLLANYFPMVFKKELIMADSEKFIAGLSIDIRKSLQNEIEEIKTSKVLDEKDFNYLEQLSTKEGMDAEVRRLADEFTNNILVGKQHLDFNAPRTIKSRFTKSRPYDIDLLNVKDFTNLDVQEVMSIYNTSVARDLGLHDAFGGAKLEDMLDIMRKELEVEQSKITDIKARDKFIKQGNDRIEDFRQTYEILQGRGNDYDPNTLLSKIGEAVRVYNNLRFMGMSPIAMIGDTSAIISQKLLQQFDPEVKAFINEIGKLKFSAKDKALMNTIAKVQSHRLHNLMELDDLFTPNKFRQGVQAVNNQFFKLIGFQFLDRNFRSIIHETIATQWIAWGKKVSEGGHLSKKELNTILSVGLDEGDLTEAYALFNTNKTKIDGVTYTNLENWGLKGKRFQAALLKKSKQDVVEASVGNRWLWTQNTNIGKMFGQFTNFILGAWSKFTLAGLQRMDKEFGTRFLASIMTGMTAYLSREIVLGKPLDQIDIRPEKLIYEAFTYGGFATLLSWADGLGGQLLPTVGLSNIGQMLGVRQASKFQDLDIIQAANPSVGLAYDTLQLPKRFLDGEITPQDWRYLIKMLPMNNAWQINWITNQVGLYDQLRRQEGERRKAGIKITSVADIFK